MESIIAALIGAVVGGGLATLASAQATRSAHRRASQLRHEDRHLDLSSQAIAALQRLVRVAIDIAYLDLPLKSPGSSDSLDQAQARLELNQATTAWNAAMYSVLLGADARVGGLLREMDHEVDRITDVAMRRTWDRDAFRDQRRALGRLMATFIDVARQEAGLAPIGLGSVWTWDEARSPASEAASA